ncbi:MAG: DUF2807 domain-containing protein [Bacteroidota bacterium]|nr:DUF2807 domain-containing protein [Bacteroidota bacterium]MDX5430094.1 DUF2807 domain-containing protein [Bacteroidota bacterium]MDX5468858.1 DUF2807 domain-containing protein [Bacteroidota bacterium]
MKSKKMLLVALLSLALFSACDRYENIRGRGAIRSEVRFENGFDAVSLRTSAEVEIHQDTAFFIEVFDYENIVYYTRTYVEHHTLVIDVERHVNLRNSKARVVIHMPDLEEVKISGSGEINISDSFHNFRKAEISGSGKISAMSVYSNEMMHVRIGGSGSIRMSGEASNLEAEISGSGRLNLFGLDAKRAYVKISGSGSSEVSASDYLEAEISGSGSVIYDGNPIVHSRISGSGTVRHR